MKTCCPTRERAKEWLELSKKNYKDACKSKDHFWADRLLLQINVLTKLLRAEK